MLVFTIPNAIRLALMQVGVIVAGILAAGIGYHAVNEIGGSMPVSTVFLVHFGLWLLALPLSWITVATRLQRNPESSDRSRTATFLCGILALVLLTLLAVYSAVAPWAQGDLLPRAG